jgi:hypothetical protein
MYILRLQLVAQSSLVIHKCKKVLGISFVIVRQRAKHQQRLVLFFLDMISLI